MLTTTKNNKCKHCKKRMPEDQARHVLHKECIEPWSVAFLAKKQAKEKSDRLKKAKVERAEIRSKKQKLKPRAKWLSECQAIVNRYVRVLALSHGQGCYTCGATPAQKFGGTYDAGHFRSVGSAPHLRFWMPQIKLQCIPCNRHQGGMALAFRRALVQEHGVEWVEALEAMQHVAKLDIPYLARLKAVMGKRLRRLEKRHVMQD